MVATPGYNPYLTTNAQGSFNIQSDGFVQGTAMDDPSARFRLRSGILALSETLCMFGGVGISENIPAPGFPANAPAGVLQSSIIRATSIQGGSAPAAGQLTGFSVFDQAYNAVQSPESPVPLIGSNGTLNYYPLGSKARIAVACDPALSALEGDITTSQVSWDFVNQLLVPYEASAYTISSGTYVSGTGVISLVLTTAYGGSPGDSVILSSLTGTGAYASLDGTWTVLSVSGDDLTVQGPVGEGAATITGGSMVDGSGTASVLPCRILGFNFGNSMTVNYNAVTSTANWNRSGNCALIQI